MKQGRNGAQQANRIIDEQSWQARAEQKPFRLEYEVHNGKLVTR